MRKYKIVILTIFALPALSTSSAHADAGVPMIFITLPYMLVALIPIIFIEMLVISKKINISLKNSFRVSSIINIISTVAGIPLTWVALVLIQMLTGGGAAHGIETPLKKFLAITWQGPWLVPYESDLYWMLPSANLFLLIPFFFASWFIEYAIAKRLLRDSVSHVVKSGIFLANLLTYSMLFVIVFGLLVLSIVQR